MALNLVDEVSHHAKDFRMFCTIAALSERVKSLGDEMDVRMDRHQFQNAQVFSVFLSC